MKTIILPGASIKNKVWAQEIAEQMGLVDYKIIEWDHWKDNSDRPLDIDLETSKVLSVISQENVQILAKSIGTYIAVKVLDRLPNQINKVILCGIPLGYLNSSDMSEKSDYQVLSGFPQDRILVYQNKNDTAGSFIKTEEFIKNINPKISVLSKPRSDHSYPYPEDFKNFLHS